MSIMPRIKCRDSGSYLHTHWHILAGGHRHLNVRWYAQPRVCQHLRVFKVVLSIYAALLRCELFTLQQLHAAASLTVSAFMRLISYQDTDTLLTEISLSTDGREYTQRNLQTDTHEDGWNAHTHTHRVTER